MPNFNFPVFPTLTTERLILKAYAPSFAQDLFEIRTSEQVLEYMDSPKHQDLAESRQMIERVIDDYAAGNGLSWAITLKGQSEMIGYFGFWRLDKDNFRGEIGYALKPAYWGQGIMSEAFQAVIPFGFEKLDLHSIEANINQSNTRSQGVLEKIGFQKEAHFRENYYFDGQFIDSIIYCLLKSDLKK